MTVCDAGPLFALVDPKQGELHQLCRFALASLRTPLITTWPCLTEAMYLAGRRGGWPLQSLLWNLVEIEVLLVSPQPLDVLFCRDLMSKFSDVPMDLADASVMALAEHLDTQEIFTLDSHFYGYRFGDGKSHDSDSDTPVNSVSPHGFHRDLPQPSSSSRLHDHSHLPRVHIGLP